MLLHDFIWTQELKSNEKIIMIVDVFTQTFLPVLRT